MLRAKRKSRVEWKDGAENVVRAQRPHPYVSERVMTTEEATRYEGHLHPGAMFVTTSHIVPLHFTAGGCFAPHEMSYVQGQSHPCEEMAPPGTLATYLGTTRVTEMDSYGHERRPSRHVFLLGATRVMVLDLRDFLPVT